MSEAITPPTQALCVNADNMIASSSTLSLDEEGIPILDEVVEDKVFDELAADLTAHLVFELEPHLQDLVRRAFTDAVRMVALDLKRAFERELNRQLETRMRILIEESVQQACKKARI